MENFNLSFPIEMIKKEERIISGIATADNVDKSGDIVDFTASLEAFKNWGGNIREMHSPIAVGKAINFEPIKIKGEDGQEYNAIRVDAYISKGAQDTWEKILDGTLQAFSIGGKVLQKSESAEKMFRGRPVNVIEKYILGELSVVDNPANALATVDIIKRSDDGGLDYVLDKAAPLKDPKGGLTAAGRAHFKETEGANLKPGVKGPADTPEKMRRKGSFLTRFFTNPSGPMKDSKGRPTRLALSAAAWGEPVPQNAQDAAELAAKGRRLLERYQNTKEKGMKKEGEVTSGSMGSGIKNPTQGSYQGPIPGKPKKKKERVMPKEMKKDSPLCDVLSEENELQYSEQENLLTAVLSEILEMSNSFQEDADSIKMQENELQNDVNYDKVLDMNEQESRLSLVKRLVNWLVPDVQETASTQVEVTENTQEENMDIEVLKDALSAVVDEKLAAFATSIKEEVEASVQEKIDTITKGFEVQTTELQEKLEATEQALTEQEEKVTAFAKSGAIKKSVDPEDDEEGEEISKSAPKSLWENTYLPQGLINSLGYKS
jgi:hypothetical protein